MAVETDRMTKKRNKPVKTGFDYITITGGHYNLIKDLKRSDDPNTCEYFYQKFVLNMKRHLTRTKLFMNGGFVFLPEMVATVRNGWAAGISLARPVAAEPDLPKKMFAKEVKGAVKSLFDPLDFSIAQQFAGTQLWQHANLLTVMDASNAHHVEIFKADLDFHQKQKSAAAASGDVIIGYPKTIIHTEPLDEQMLRKLQQQVLGTASSLQGAANEQEKAAETDAKTIDNDRVKEDVIYQVTKKQLENIDSANTIDDTLHSVAMKEHEKMGGDDATTTTDVEIIETCIEMKGHKKGGHGDATATTDVEIIEKCIEMKGHEKEGDDDATATTDVEITEECIEKVSQSQSDSSQQPQQTGQSLQESQLECGTVNVKDKSDHDDGIILSANRQQELDAVVDDAKSELESVFERSAKMVDQVVEAAAEKLRTNDESISVTQPSETKVIPETKTIQKVLDATQGTETNQETEPFLVKETQETQTAQGTNTEAAQQTEAAQKMEPSQLDVLEMETVDWTKTSQETEAQEIGVVQEAKASEGDKVEEDVVRQREAQGIELSQSEVQDIEAALEANTAVRTEVAQNTGQSETEIQETETTHKSEAFQKGKEIQETKLLQVDKIQEMEAIKQTGELQDTDSFQVNDVLKIKAMEVETTQQTGLVQETRLCEREDTRTPDATQNVKTLQKIEPSQVEAKEIIKDHEKEMKEETEAVGIENVDVETEKSKPMGRIEVISGLSENYKPIISGVVEELGESAEIVHVDTVNSVEDNTRSENVQRPEFSVHKMHEDSTTEGQDLNTGDEIVEEAMQQEKYGDFVTSMQTQPPEASMTSQSELSSEKSDEQYTDAPEFRETEEHEVDKNYHAQDFSNIAEIKNGKNVIKAEIPAINMKTEISESIAQIKISKNVENNGVVDGTKTQFTDNEMKAENISKMDVLKSDISESEKPENVRKSHIAVMAEILDVTESHISDTAIVEQCAKRDRNSESSDEHILGTNHEAAEDQINDCDKNVSKNEPFSEQIVLVDLPENTLNNSANEKYNEKFSGEFSLQDDITCRKLMPNGENQSKSTSPTYSTLFGSSFLGEKGTTNIIYEEYHDKNSILEHLPEEILQSDVSHDIPKNEANNKEDMNDVKSEEACEDIAQKVQSQQSVTDNQILSERSQSHGLANFISSTLPDSVQNLFSSTKEKFDEMFIEGDSTDKEVINIHCTVKTGKVTDGDERKHKAHAESHTAADLEYGLSSQFSDKETLVVDNSVKMEMFDDHVIAGSTDAHISSETPVMLETTTGNGESVYKKHQTGLFEDTRSTEDFDFEFIH
ncbi:unnamed protein product [Thelazia callipaeda]|uniref:ULP_PROTEASE domain-containing protein n=1 Tax=Thelazia callipaeda TaxID=103827 RepID=A0A0N5CLJ1_THECL|nr:unnamed protein product [Thelazia callipaeda]